MHLSGSGVLKLEGALVSPGRLKRECWAPSPRRVLDSVGMAGCWGKFSGSVARVGSLPRPLV